MTERDDIVFGTSEAELPDAVAFDDEPLQPLVNVKAELVARISSSGSENTRVDVIESPRRRTWVRRLAGATATVFLVTGGFTAGRAWTMRGMSDETKFNASNQASDYSQVSHKMADGHAIRLVWSYKEHLTALIISVGMQIPRGKAV